MKAEDEKWELSSCGPLGCDRKRAATKYPGAWVKRFGH